MGQAPSCTDPAGTAAVASSTNTIVNDSQLAGSSSTYNAEQHSYGADPAASSCSSSAAASPMAAQAEAAGLLGASASPRLGEQLSALSPFAKARGFMAQREADAMAWLKVSSTFV
jgi:hypothetical protein